MKITTLLAQSSRPFYSLEFFPPREEAHLPDFFAATEALRAVDPLFVSVTYGAGGARQANTLEIALALKNRCGFEPMTHLTCVASQKDHIAAFLDQLHRQGIDNVLALRGDAPKPVRPEDPLHDWAKGDFRHASDLVAFIRTHFPDFCIGVAGYPSPHPESPSRELDRVYTLKKLAAGGDFLITQLFFDPQAYRDFTTELHAQGMHKPVLPGIMPIQSLESLKYLMNLCGAALPEVFRQELEAAHAQGGQTAVRNLGIRHAAGLIRSLVAAGAPGVHLYTLNKAELCLNIIEQAGDLSRIPSVRQ